MIFTLLVTPTNNPDILICQTVGIEVNQQFNLHNGLKLSFDAEELDEFEVHYKEDKPVFQLKNGLYINETITNKLAAKLFNMNRHFKLLNSDCIEIQIFVTKDVRRIFQDLFNEVIVKTVVH